MRLFLAMLVCLSTSLFSAGPRAQSDVPTINNLADLSEEIDRIRFRNAAPGIAVGLVQSGQPNWQYYSGVSDLKTRIPLNKNSQFRFGSIAKMIVSLSMLKLVEEGKIDLDAKLRDIAPEIEFSNPWESTHPLRIVHLLSHSTGWDSPHFTEQRPLLTTPIAIIDALKAHPHSRVSRWQPGSRIAYNNTGFLAAAYVIEKLTDMSYETFVEQTFFSPLNMNHSGYYFSDIYRESAVSLYINNKVQPYEHLNNRAAGGLNSSIEDMLKFVRLLAQKSPSSAASPALLKAFRMPSGTKAANEGLTFTWGPGNQLFHSNGVPLYGHEGSLKGTNSMLVYNQKYALGYVIVGNSNSPAVNQIHVLIADYLTKNIEVPEVKTMRKLNKTDHELTGWYKNAAPISDRFSFIQTIMPWKFYVKENTAFIKPMIGASPRRLIPNETVAFKQDTTGLVALVPSNDEALGKIIYYGPNTLVKTNAVNALMPMFIIIFWVFMSVSGLIFLLIWLFKQVFKRTIPCKLVALRVWPISALGIAIATLICVRYIANSPNMYELAGTMSVFSVLVFIGSLAFFIVTLWSVYIFYQHRKLAMNKFTKWHAGLFILAHVMLAILLLSHGLIGLRLWV